MTSVKFNVGEKVFAKMRTYCAWPSRVEGVADFTPGKIKYHIYFYGSRQVGVCKESELFSYSCDNIAKYGKPKKIKYFNAGMKELEADTDNIRPTSESLDDLQDTDSTKVSVQTNNLSKSNLEPVEQMLPTVAESDPRFKLLNVLKTESRLLDIQFEIQNSLGLTLEKTNPKLCLKLLDELIALNIDSLMVKKHSEVVIFLNKLQNYGGNMRTWNLSEEEKLLFNSQALMIRMKAKLAFNKVQSLFNVPYGMTFEDFFAKQVEDFKKDTEHLSQTDYFYLMTS